MKLLARFSHRFLARHPGQLALALAGIAAGVAVVTGVALMRDVLLSSLDAAATLLSGTESIRIENPRGKLDEQVYADLALTPGAPALMPVLSAQARVDGELIELLAIDPLSVRSSRTTAVGPGAAGALLGAADGALANRATLDRLGRAPDETVRVEWRGRALDLSVLPPIRGGDGLDNRLILDLATAQDLLDRRGELSWIEAPASAADWLERHVPEPLSRVSSGERRASAARLTSGMRTNLTAMSLLAMLVGLFVIYSVLAFLLVQRRRSIGMLRAVGVTRSRIAAVLAVETAALAGLGALIGLALGTELAGRLVELVRAPVGELYGLLPGQGIQPTAGLYATVWLGAVVASVISVSGLVREALRIPPGQLARLHDSAPGRTGKGAQLSAAGLAAVGLIALFNAPGLNTVLVALLLLLCSCALLVPGAGMRLLRLGHRLSPWQLSSRAMGMLGTARRRLAPSLAALSLALGLSAGMAMMVMGFRVAVDDWVDRLLRADAYLTLASSPIDDDLVDRIEARPEIETVSSVRQRRLPDGQRLLAYDLPERAWAGFEWLAGGGTDARRAFENGRGVLISEPLARRRDLEPGQTLSLPVPGDPREIEVVAIYRDYASDRGVIAIDGESYRRWFDDPLRDSLGLYGADGNPDFSRLLTELAAEGFDASLTDREAVRRQTLAVFDRTFRITWALAVLVALIAAFALISALLALGLERGREYATLRALGLTRRGLAIWIMTQTTALAAITALLALPISLLIHIVLSQFVQPMAFGWSVDLTLPWQPWAALLPLAILTGTVAGIYPAWTIARRDPAPRLRAA
jgi:putative ABC transport system permease protein